MRVDVGAYEIRVFEKLNCSRWENEIVSFLNRNDEWSTGGSMCLPSDFESAKQVVACYNKAIEEVEKAIKELKEQ